MALILVTGGAGFLGINLCRHFLRLGHRVRSLDIADFAYPERGSVEALRGDIRNCASVDAAMKDVSIVVHCAAALPQQSAWEIHSTNVEGTRLLLGAAPRFGIDRFVFISSTAVYGIPDHHPLTERDPLHGVGPYGKSKIAGEQLCLQYRAAGHCVPILRPKTFVGPERLGVFELLYRWAYEGRNFPVLGEGTNRYQLLDVADLCEVIERCCLRDDPLVNDTFNVGAAQFGTMRENIECVLAHAGKGGHVVSLPEAPARWALGLLRALHLSPLYAWIYATAAADSYVSIDRLQQCLQYVPRSSNAAALIKNYDWYLAHRAEYRERTGKTHRLPWNEGALALARHFF